MKKQNLTTNTYFENNSMLNGCLVVALEMGTVEGFKAPHKYDYTYEYNISRRFSDHGY